MLHVAVSGGPNSIALLLLANGARPHRVRAATVDHGLRPESAGEARFVADVCEGLGVPHAILPVTVGPGNVQSQAREARYGALTDWIDAIGDADDALATGHHADDQAETLLMRLNRASGLAGLAGIRERAQLTLRQDRPIALVRPLLGWRRSDLAQIVSDAGIAPVDDPSNRNQHYDRVQMREHLARSSWIDPVALAQSARLLGDAWSAIQDMAQAEGDRRITQTGAGIDYRAGAPATLEIEIMARVIARLGGKASRAEIDRLRGRLVVADNGSLGGVLAKPIVEEGITIWRFTPEPPRRL